MTDRQVDHIANLIYDAPLGEYIGRDGSATLANHAGEKRHLSAGEYLYRQGVVTNRFYIVVSGRLALLREKTAERDEQVMHELSKGDLVGELSFIDQTPHRLSVRAISDATALCFKAGDIQPLITKEPLLIYNFMRAIIKRANRIMTTMDENEMALQQYIQTGGRGRI